MKSHVLFLVSAILPAIGFFSCSDKSTLHDDRGKVEKKVELSPAPTSSPPPTEIPVEAKVPTPTTSPVEVQPAPPELSDEFQGTWTTGVIYSGIGRGRTTKTRHTYNIQKDRVLVHAECYMEEPAPNDAGTFGHFADMDGEIPFEVNAKNQFEITTPNYFYRGWYNEPQFNNLLINCSASMAPALYSLRIQEGELLLNRETPEYPYSIRLQRASVPAQ